MTTTQVDPVDEMVAQACALAERHGGGATPDERAVAEVALVRAELCWLAGACADGPLAEDVDGAICELDTLLARLGHEPPGVGALSA